MNHPLFKSARWKTRGWTLIELLVVIMILVLLLLIAVPFYLRYREHAQDTAAKANLHLAFLAARGQAADSPDGAYSTPASAIANTITADDPSLTAGTGQWCSATDGQPDSFVSVDSDDSGATKIRLYVLSKSGTVWQLDADKTGDPTISTTCGAPSPPGGGGSGGSGGSGGGGGGGGGGSGSSAPVLSGTFEVGDTITTSDGTWDSSLPLTYSYAWERCDDSSGNNCSTIPGKTASTYTLADTDVAKYIRSIVTADNGRGTGTETSGLGGPVVALPPVPVAGSQPVLTGTFQVGNDLTSTTGTWTGSDPKTFTYAFKRCDPGPVNCNVVQTGAAQTYTIVNADAGKQIYVTVTALNAGGTASADSDPVGITAAMPVGLIIPYTGSTIPAGWSLADGSAVSRITYNALFTAIGTTYGAGDGSSTFNLPDLRGRFGLGKSSSGTGSSLGDSGGSFNSGAGTFPLTWSAHTFSLPQAPTVTLNNLSAHSHTWSGGYRNDFHWEATYTFGWDVGSSGSGGTVNDGAVSGLTGSAGSVGATTLTSSTGSQSVSVSGADAPFAVVRYLIRVSPTAGVPGCALWSYAGASAPSGSTFSQGQAATGAAATCLDPAYGGALPDMRQRFPVGQATSGTASTLGATGGSIDHTHTVTIGARTYTVNVPDHTHSFTMPSHGGSIGGVSSGGYDSARYSPFYSISTGGSAGPNSDAGTVYTSSAGGGGAFTAITSGSVQSTAPSNPPFMALNYLEQTTLDGNISPGSVTPYAGSDEPNGWLRADGRCVSQTTYPALYTAISPTFGAAGCSAGEFRLPDLRQRFPLGKSGSGTGSTLGGTGGEIDHTENFTVPGDQPTLTIPAHHHTWSIPDHTHHVTLTGSATAGTGGGGSATTHFYAGDSFTSSAAGGQSLDSINEPARILTANETSSSQQITTPTDNPPYLTLNYLIKY